MHEKASLLAQEHGVHAKGSIVEGREVQAILYFLRQEGADLLVIGLHQHDLYLSPFGVPFMISQRTLPAACSACIERADQEQGGISVEIVSDFGGSTA